MPNEARARLTLAAVAFASLSAQVALTRVFSFLFWHHYAWLILSIALLGYGIAGAQLAAERARGGGGATEAEVGAALVRLSRSLPLALLFVALYPFSPDLFLGDPFEFLRFLVNGALLVLPFRDAGRVAGLLYAEGGPDVGARYAADLAGAAAGAFLFALLLPLLDPFSWVLALALALGALARSWDGHRPLSHDPGALAVAFLLALLLSGRAIPLLPTESKDLFLPLLDASGVPTTPEWTRWHVASRIDVLERPAFPLFGFGGETALRARTAPMPRKAIFQDAGAPTFLYRLDRPLADYPGLVDNNQALAYRVAASPEVLVVGPGGGPDLLIALANGATRVTAVEINPLIVGLVTGPYRAYTGDLFFRPGVDLVNLDGRAFARLTERRFDLIQISGVDTFAALSAGANACSENYLYTVDALGDFLGRLTDRGLISFSRWIFTPPRETLRLFLTARAALERLGVTDPRAHLVVVRGRAWATLLIKRSPFTRAEVAAVAAAIAGTQFTLLYEPFGTHPNEFGRAADPDPAKVRAFIADYAYAVEPVTDDAPYFFNYYRWRSLFDGPGARADVAGSGGYGITRLPLGNAVLLAALAVAAPACLLFILGPLAALPPGRGPGATFAYFFGLGLAFVAVEIALVQKFTLFLGLPGLAFAAVIPLLLAGAGLGAARARATTPARAALLALLAALLAIPLLRTAVYLRIASLPLRLAVTALAVLPVGFCLGRPFPAGLARIAPAGPARTAWAYGANAGATVLGSILAALAGMEWGLSATLALAAFAYLLAALAGRRL